jgi:crossover junction endodeoxyribonuclease RuvC
MRIIGVDPGLNKTGWAVIEKSSDNKVILLEHGVIKPSAKQATAARLGIIFKELSYILERYKPNIGAVEEIYVNKNFASSLSLAEARAASMIALDVAGVEVYSFPSRQVKKVVTGYGAADKDQVKHMLKMIFPAFREDALSDESDAAAVALCLAFSLN